MEMVGSPPIDHFDFNHGARISPYLSAPSSPKRFGEIYLSAPTSPSRISELYSEFEYFSISSSTPFDLEHKSGTPKAEDGFAFVLGGESQKSPRSAEDLFDGGKIKPLKEDNEFLESAKSPLLSPKKPRRSSMAQGKKVIREAFSPRKKNESDNPFANSNREREARRGRDRTPASASASISTSESGRRVTRSHSPYRISHHIWDEETHQQPESNKEDITKASLSSTSSSSSSSFSKSFRKWRLRDFLLFRSASEGRGSSKDALRKYPFLFKKPEEGKGSSFRSSDQNPRSRRKEPVSAHELHYARKKAESEDLKKRTFLPYKQGILGRLAGLGSLQR